MKKSEEQHSLFDTSEYDRRHEYWRGMPSYTHEDLTPIQTVYVHFEKVEDRKAFAELIGQTITERTQSIWFPKATITTYVDKRYRHVSEG